MATGVSGIDAEASGRQATCAAGASTAGVLRLLGAGATGAILMALGEGPLRTKDLTERVPDYAPRTIYRYAGKLAELKVVEREEEPGVPSKVVHTLTDPCGTELHALVDRFADASLTRLPDGRIDAYAWGSLGLLADLWESGMVAELGCGARSPAELARGPLGLSYHQVNRRAGLLKAGGLLRERQSPGRSRRYELTERTRRKMGLIAGLVRWRHQHVVASEEEGMTAAEMATVLRLALPLVKLPNREGSCLQLRVSSEDEAAGAQRNAVWAEVEADGAVHSCPNRSRDPDGWAEAEVAAWIPVMMDRDPRRVFVGGDRELVGDCLSELYAALWTPNPF